VVSEPGTRMRDGDEREKLLGEPRRRKVADLEAEIERLSDAAERCRKIMMGARLAIGASALFLVITTPDLFWLGPAAFVAAISAVLGGIVVLGSNKSTRDELMAAIRVHEAQRAEVIDGLRLRDVGEVQPAGAERPGLRLEESKQAR
jgi:hypothetical protein